MINVYTKQRCIHCVHLKEYLNERGLEFTEIDVQYDEEVKRRITEEWGYKQVPVVEFEGDTILNPSPDALEEFLQGGSAFDEL